MKISNKFIEFLVDLEFNNNRDWFLANKSRYENDVKLPFLQFVDEIKTRLLVDEPNLADVETKKMIFRLHRDTRFAKDKSPYKTHVSALVSPFGTKDKSFPSNYLQISANEVFIAGGIYWFEEKELLERVRKYIFNNNEQFSKLIADKTFIEKFGEIKGEKNKRLPKEFAEFEKNQPLIANKQFYWSANFKPEILFQENCVDEFVSYFNAAKRLKDFLTTAVKD